MRAIRGAFGEVTVSDLFPLGAPTPNAVAAANTESYALATGSRPSVYGAGDKRMLRLSAENRQRVIEKLRNTNAGVSYDPVSGTAIIFPRVGDLGGVSSQDDQPNMLQILAFIMGQGKEPPSYGQVAPKAHWQMPHGAWVYVRLYASGQAVMPMVMLMTSPMEPEPCGVQFSATNNGFGCDAYELLVPREKLEGLESAGIEKPGYFSGMSIITGTACAAIGGWLGYVAFRTYRKMSDKRSAAR